MCVITIRNLPVPKGAATRQAYSLRIPGNAPAPIISAEHDASLDEALCGPIVVSTATNEDSVTTQPCPKWTTSYSSDYDPFRPCHRISNLRGDLVFELSNP